MPSIFASSQNVFDPKLTSLFSAEESPKKPQKNGKTDLRTKTSDLNHASDASTSDASSSSENDQSQLSDSESEASSSDSSSSNSASSDKVDAFVSPAEAVDDTQDALAEPLPNNVSSNATSDDAHSSKPSRRKRKRDNDDLESKHLQKLADEETKEKRRRIAQRSLSDDQQLLGNSDSEIEEEQGNVVEGDAFDTAFPIQHESLSKSDEDPELEKASRTIFLSNVSTLAMTSKADFKLLKNHLTSFPTTTASQTSKEEPKIESVRFRSTAYAGVLPRKAAFARKELMSSTTKSTNAYVVYTTQQAARDAARYLNGTVALSRHLRVDLVSSPAKIDHRRCVFVGNLGYVDEPSQINESADGTVSKKKKKSQQGDVEEGLWQQFLKAGPVESVRVPRDPKTRVGKGFAYVQFKSENAVEAAILFNDKNYPPLLPRKLRVVRAKKVRADGSGGSKPPARLQNMGKAKKPSASPTTTDQALKSHVKRLLGKAGAAQLRNPGSKNPSSSAIKSPESFIFEGHRASRTQGNKGLRLNKSGGKKPTKAKNGRTKRASAWKASQKAKGQS